METIREPPALAARERPALAKREVAPVEVQRPLVLSACDDRCSSLLEMPPSCLSCRLLLSRGSVLSPAAAGEALHRATCAGGTVGKIVEIGGRGEVQSRVPGEDADLCSQTSALSQARFS